MTVEKVMPVDIEMFLLQKDAHLENSILITYVQDK